MTLQVHVSWDICTPSPRPSWASWDTQGHALAVDDAQRVAYRLQAGEATAVRRGGRPCCTIVLSMANPKSCNLLCERAVIERRDWLCDFFARGQLAYKAHLAASSPCIEPMQRLGKMQPAKQTRPVACTYVQRNGGCAIQRPLLARLDLPFLRQAQTFGHTHARSFT